MATQHSRRAAVRPAIATSHMMQNCSRLQGQLLTQSVQETRGPAGNSGAHYCASVTTRGSSLLAGRGGPVVAGTSLEGVRGSAFLRFTTTILSDVAVLHVAGEVDLSNAVLLAGAITGAFAVHRRIMVDLQGLAYIDVGGIRILERASQENPGRFVVVGPNSMLRRLFEFLELDGSLPVMASAEAAREYLVRQ
jgi:anti-anti-sigma factor